MKDPLQADEPPKPPKPGDRPPKPGKPPLYKDKRTHRIELRQKIAAFKEEINELKAIETEDEGKQAEIQEKMSVLKTRLKECAMEKEAIENFNHTQFVKNVQKSREDESRYDEEARGNTRFFGNLTKNANSEDGSVDSRWNLEKDEKTEGEAADVTLSPEQEPEALPAQNEVESNETLSEREKPEETEEEAETEAPLPQIEIPPNTIV